MQQVRVFSLVALALVTGTGILALWLPFGVDQAIFVYGGRAVLEGDELYRDFWDIKPPGIFLFYAFAGSLAGFDESAVHSLELIWQLATPADEAVTPAPADG